MKLLATGVRLTFAVAVLIVAVACGDATSVPAAPKATATPQKAWDYTVKPTDSSTPVTLLSEAEVRDMQTHVTTLAQIAGASSMPSYHGVANLSAGTHLKQTGGRTYTLDLAWPGHPDTHLNFYAVRVVDGPARDLEGWISAAGITS